MIQPIRSSYKRRLIGRIILLFPEYTNDKSGVFVSIGKSIEILLEKCKNQNAMPTDKQPLKLIREFI
jgi:hypothetical protein